VRCRVLARDLQTQARSKAVLLRPSPSLVQTPASRPRGGSHVGTQSISVHAPLAERLAREVCRCRRTVDPCNNCRAPSAIATPDFPATPGVFAFGVCPPCISRWAAATRAAAAESGLDGLALVVISRNYESYLCGHSIYAWHLCHYLVSRTPCTVYHIMHHPHDGLCHGKQICPPIRHERYHAHLVDKFDHGKLPESFRSCSVADELDLCIARARRGREDRPVAVLCISPFVFGADVLHVARAQRPPVPCYASMRGTDLLLLKKAEFRETPVGRRYLRALRDMEGVYVQSEWMLGEAAKLGVPANGCFQTFTDIPNDTDLDATWSYWCASVGFDPKDTRPLVCYVGRLSPEKGAIAIARAFRQLLATRHDARVLVAGSGPSDDQVRSIVPLVPGRSAIARLSIFEVFAVARHCGQLRQSVLVTAPGFEGEFQEALGSTYIYFASQGTPVLFPVDTNTGGCLETVSPQNAAWCRDVGLPVEGWPGAIARLLDGEYDDLGLRSANADYCQRFLADLQVGPRLAEWFAAARSASRGLLLSTEEDSHIGVITEPLLQH